MFKAKKYLCALAMVAGLAFGGGARADQDPLLVISSGTWETLRAPFRTGEVDVDYRFGTDLIWKIRPQIGMLAAGDGDYYGYGGFVADIDLIGGLVLTLNTSIGGYGGHGYDLGSRFEFRNGLEVAYRLVDDWRIGLGFYHISNAGITRENGGSESALISLSVPMPW
jgi:lipid A 3-O-deacylase